MSKIPLWRRIKQMRPAWTDLQCHAAADTLTQTRWNVITRCTYPRATRYRNYGGRGIRVCDEWADLQNGTVAFATWAMSHGWAPGLEIDRVDNDGNYEPDNCRWVSRTANNNNRSNNHKIPIPVTIVRGWLGCNGVQWRELMESGTEAIAAALVRRREKTNAERTQRKERLTAGKCPICGCETTHVYRAPAANYRPVIVGCPHCTGLTDIFTAARDAGAIKG